MDDFFALGGHSVVATRPCLSNRGRLRRRHPVAHPLRAAGTARPGARDHDRGREPGAQSSAATSSEPIRTAVRQAGDEVPVSFAQQRLWFLSQLEPDSPLYNVPVCYRMTGSPDVAALSARARCPRLAPRSAPHHARRRGGEPHQRIGLPFPVPIAFDDAESERDALSIARDEAGAPFDIETGPLLRARLIRVGTRPVVPLPDLPPSGVRRVVARHPRPRAGRALRRSDRARCLPRSAAIRGRSGERSRTTRRRGSRRRAPVVARAAHRHAGRTRASHRPFPARAAVVRGRGDTRSRSRPRPWTGWRSSVTATNATLFMTLLAAVDVLFARYSGQDDIAVGSPVAGRTRARDDECRRLVREHSGAPDGHLGGSDVRRPARPRPPRLHRRLQPPGPPVREDRRGAGARSRPLAQPAVPGDGDPPERAGSHARARQQRARARRHRPGSVALRPHRLLLAVARTDFASPSNMQPICSTRRRSSASASTSQPCSTRSARTRSDPSRISPCSTTPNGRSSSTRGTRHRRGSTTSPACITSFARRAIETPHAEAVIDPTERITYAEFDLAANRLAQHLIALGVAPRHPRRPPHAAVRSMLVAIVGDLEGRRRIRAARTDVPGRPPRDSWSTTAQLARHLHAASASRHHSRPTTPSWFGSTTPLIGPRSTPSPPNRPRYRCGPDDLAYVIFTSGSTGTPQGRDDRAPRRREPHAVMAEAPGLRAGEVDDRADDARRSTFRCPTCSCR